MIDLPPSLDTQIVGCIASAAAHYQADPQAVIDRILKRKGKTGEIRQANGTREIGIYGIPESRLKDLGPTQVSREKIRDDDCLNISLGIFLDRKAQLQPTVAIAAKAGAAISPGITASSGPRLPKLDAKAEQCVDAAAAAYQLPRNVFRAVLRTEGGWVGLKKRNTNGSYDMGPGQINTIHLPELSKLGITEQMLVGDACINVHVAAYRLRLEIERVQDFWRGVGNYHSRTPHLHQAYLKRVQAHL